MEKLLAMAQTDQEKILLRRLLDLDKRADQSGYYAFSPFLSPAELELCRRAQKYLCCTLDEAGGYEQAERRLLIFCPDAMPSPANTSENYPLRPLKLTYKANLSHRDILGSLMSLGIKREALGDILVLENCSYIFVTVGIYDFVLSNLQQVGGATVILNSAQFAEILPPAKRVKEIRSLVKSLRLDAVVAAAFNLSRSEAQAAIGHGLCLVNSRPTTSTIKQLVAGDILSLRGHGKAALKEIGGKSKKDRIYITIEQYL